MNNMNNIISISPYPVQKYLEISLDILDRTLNKDVKQRRADNLLNQVRKLAFSQLNAHDADIIRKVFNNLVIALNQRHGNNEFKKVVAEAAVSTAVLLPKDYPWLVEAYFDNNAIEDKATRIKIFYDITNYFFENSIGVCGITLQNVIKIVMKSLEVNLSESTILVLLDFGFLLGKMTPNFENYFIDFVDFILGWMVGSTSPTFISSCFEVLSQMKKFWIDNLQYGNVLMTGLSDDVYRFCLCGNNAQESTFPRARTMVLAFSGFAQIYIEVGGVAVIDTIVEIARGAVQIFVQACQILKDRRTEAEVAAFITSFADLFTGFCKIHPLDKPPVEQLVKTLIEHILTLFESFSAHVGPLTSLLNNLSKLLLITTLPNHIILPIIDKFLEKDGIYEKIIFYDNLSACKSVSSVINSCLSHTSLPILQKTYAHSRRIIQDSVAELEELSNKCYKQLWKVRTIEPKLITLVHSFSQISVSKNNLIVMMGMSPSLLNVMLEDFPATSQWFVDSHPTLTTSILKIVYQHASSHEYFLASSDWVKVANVNAAISESRTKNNMEFQIQKMTELLSINIKWKLILDIVADWLTGLFDLVGGSTLNHWYCSQPLVKNLYTQLQKKLLLGCGNEKLQTLVKRFEPLSVATESEAIDYAITTVRTMRQLDVNEGAKMWSRLDTKNFIRCGLNPKGWDACEMHQVRLNSSCIGPDDFVFLTDFLLKRIMCSYKKNPQCDDNWLIDSVQQICGKVIGKNAGFDESSFDEKWRWVLAQLAFFCVENKMKTPLGKPVDTFQQFGAEIHRLAKEALGVVPKVAEKATERSVPKKAHKDKDEDEDDDYGLTRPLTSSEEWFRVRCLLEFLDVLDKIMFVAHSGSLYPIANMSQQARQFFTMNVGSCQEWLNRVYSSAMVVAYHNGYYAQVVRFGTAALSEFERKQKKAEQEAEEKNQELKKVVPSAGYVVLGWLARAMAELGAEQSARGLKKWAMQVYNVELNWLDGIAEMAAGHYELALSKLTFSLERDSLPDVTKVLLRHIVLDILRILRLPDLLDHSSCPPDISILSLPPGQMNTDYIPEGFEADAWEKVKNLCSFTILDKVGPASVSWDVTRMVEHKELTLMQTLRRVDVQEIKKDMTKIGHLVFCYDSGQRLATNLATLDRIFSAVLGKMSREVLETVIDDLSIQTLFTESSLPDLGLRFSQCVKLLFWADRLALRTGFPRDFYREAVRLARKSGNVLSANAILHKFRNYPTTASSSCFKTAIQEIKLNLMGPRSVAEKQDQLVRLSNTLIMELRIQQQNRMAYYNLPNKELDLEDKSLNDVISSSCLLLAKLLEDENVGAPVLKNNEFKSCWDELKLPCLFPDARPENIVYGFLSMATVSSPRNAKAHLRLADWVYKVATTPEEDRTLFDIKQKLTLGCELSQTTLDGLWNACINSNSTTKLQRDALAALGGDAEAANCLLTPGSHYMKFYQARDERVASLLPYAIREYFEFLRLLDYDKNKSIGTVSAALRILGMIVRYPSLLSRDIVDGLCTVSPHVWKDILPQLFSRLSHPSEKIRQTIVLVISKIALTSPHSVIFQIISGASSTMVVESDDAIGAEKDEDDIATKDRSLMFSCCEDIEKHIEPEYPGLVRDTREFISELQKINLLYEERWMFVLSHLDHEMNKRLDQIRVESLRTMQAAHLDDKARTEIVAEKTRLITTSVYRILWDLYERTCLQPPSTPNEKAFVDSYGDQLRIAFESSKANKKSPEKAWSPFKQLLTALVQKNSRAGQITLLMENISTYLANLSSSNVPIPGQENLPFEDIVYISKVRPTAQVLATKTRPKKMSFVGSDGKMHIFLFKGQEDLHLDERIMQLLNICNLMLHSSTKRSWPAYNARHYAVTPLGTRSGLIQWVVGATPMFYLYRKWQTRQAQLKADSKTGAKAVEAERPTDIFHKTLRRAFASHNVDSANAADRSKWPHDVLREVLESLLKETPKDILSRELWLKSGGGDTWWRVVSRLARSTAVMSMIGAILGLGDRHLDNLLVNLDTGDIVHIDYNICFDKGKNLRVPETVPFRMTQNMVSAMGPTQLEGTFRLSCYHVLSTLRDQREILLTILDAFVYDPLVDWAANDHLTSTSATVGVAVTLAVYGTHLRASGAKPVAREMFSVRVRELTTPWKNNCNELTFALQNVKNVLKRQMANPKDNVWMASNIIEQDRVEAGRRLKLAISQHHQMMKDVRPLLRALATCDERFANYTKTYRAVFSEPLVKGHLHLDAQANDLTACIDLFQTVLDNIEIVYSDLLLLNSKAESSSTSSSPSIQSTFNLQNLSLDTFASKQEQEQNAHARSIVKRVQARLEGHIESGSKVPLICAEQADNWIRQATNKSLLALMYEGWTAWV
ncbi:unnamed protein product [Auanema sp. JU1783]|nr:unnamed protein product [Auanema sp. JU1783]